MRASVALFMAGEGVVRIAAAAKVGFRRRERTPDSMP
jgi:hypothetical protein